MKVSNNIALLFEECEKLRVLMYNCYECGDFEEEPEEHIDVEIAKQQFIETNNKVMTLYNTCKAEIKKLLKFKGKMTEKMEIAIDQANEIDELLTERIYKFPITTILLNTKNNQSNLDNLEFFISKCYMHDWMKHVTTTVMACVNEDTDKYDDIFKYNFQALHILLKYNIDINQKIDGMTLAERIVKYKYRYVNAPQVLLDKIKELKM